MCIFCLDLMTGLVFLCNLMYRVVGFDVHFAQQAVYKYIAVVASVVAWTGVIMDGGFR